MSKRDAKLFLEDIIAAIDKIERYISGIKSKEEFMETDMVVDAVLRNLEVIGEAAKNIPAEVKEKYPEIPWKRVIGLRNVVAHGYFVVDLEIIWRIIKEQLPDLKSKIKVIFEELK